MEERANDRAETPPQSGLRQSPNEAYPNPDKKRPLTIVRHVPQCRSSSLTEASNPDLSETGAGLSSLHEPVRLTAHNARHPAAKSAESPARYPAFIMPARITGISCIMLSLARSGSSSLELASLRPVSLRDPIFSRPPLFYPCPFVNAACELLSAQQRVIPPSAAPLFLP